MEESVFALILTQCLDAMEHGDEAEAVVEKYPVLKGDLLPLLSTAARLRETSGSLPVPTEFLRQLGDSLKHAETF